MGESLWFEAQHQEGAFSHQHFHTGELQTSRRARATLRRLILIINI